MLSPRFKLISRLRNTKCLTIALRPVHGSGYLLRPEGLFKIQEDLGKKTVPKKWAWEKKLVSVKI